MEILQLDRELYRNILIWMKPKYALSTYNKRKSYLKKLFKTYKILSRDNIGEIMRHIKYQHQRACLTMINTYCIENNIDFYMFIPTIKLQAQKHPDILSSEEIKLMIKAAPKPYDLCIRCIFNFGAGLRISEIIKLKWDHIRWVDWLHNKDNYGIAQIKSGKGSKDRPVNIPKNLMHDLYEHAIKRGVLNEFKIPSGGAIFEFGAINEKTGKLYNENLLRTDPEQYKESYVKSRYDWFLYHIIKKHCEKALGKHIKVHSLRHSRATYLYEIEKVPIEKIQILLGHSSLNTTLLYTKINPVGIFDLIKNTSEI